MHGFNHPSLRTSGTVYKILPKKNLEDFEGWNQLNYINFSPLPNAEILCKIKSYEHMDS